MYGKRFGYVITPKKRYSDDDEEDSAGSEDAIQIEEKDEPRPPKSTTAEKGISDLLESYNRIFALESRAMRSWDEHDRRADMSSRIDRSENVHDAYDTRREHVENLGDASYISTTGARRPRSSRDTPGHKYYTLDSGSVDPRLVPTTELTEKEEGWSGVCRNISDDPANSRRSERTASHTLPKYVLASSSAGARLVPEEVPLSENSSQRTRTRPAKSIPPSVRSSKASQRKAQPSSSYRNAYERHEAQRHDEQYRDSTPLHSAARSDTTTGSEYTKMYISASPTQTPRAILVRTAPDTMRDRGPMVREEVRPVMTYGSERNSRNRRNAADRDIVPYLQDHNWSLQEGKTTGTPHSLFMAHDTSQPGSPPHDILSPVLPRARRLQRDNVDVSKHKEEHKTHENTSDEEDEENPTQIRKSQSAHKPASCTLQKPEQSTIRSNSILLEKPDLSTIVRMHTLECITDHDEKWGTISSLYRNKQAFKHRQPPATTIPVLTSLFTYQQLIVEVVYYPIPQPAVDGQIQPVVDGKAGSETFVVLAYPSYEQGKRDDIRYRVEINDKHAINKANKASLIRNSIYFSVEAFPNTDNILEVPQLEKAVWYYDFKVGLYDPTNAQQNHRHFWRACVKEISTKL